MSARFIAILVLIALVVIFIFQNLEVVKVSFLFWEISSPRALMIFITLVIGVIVGYLSNKGKPLLKKK